MELKKLKSTGHRAEYDRFLTEFPVDADVDDYAEIKRYFNYNTAASYARLLRQHAKAHGFNVRTRIFRQNGEFVVYARVNY